MAKEKYKCIYCKKSIKKSAEYCKKCGRDVRSMWEVSKKESITHEEPMYCPMPDCHALYTKGRYFCIQCGNDFARRPPIYKKDFGKKLEVSDKIYCPECGNKCNEDDVFCDCGCDFRRNPKVSVPPEVIKNKFYCAMCNAIEVSFPGGICSSCTEKNQVYICPECNRNSVEKFGDICKTCIEQKPIKGIGIGFKAVKKVR